MQFCSECHNMYYLKIKDENEEVGNTLIYYCRNCGHEDVSLSTTNICVSDMQIQSSEKQYSHIVNEYTKYDPTLPRINTIKCPNQDCSSNLSMQGGGGAGEASKKAATKKTTIKPKTTTVKKTKTQKKDSLIAADVDEDEDADDLETNMGENAAAAPMDNRIVGNDIQNNQEVIYIRYDDTNMKYVYLCVHCNTTWRTDNKN